MARFLWRAVQPDGTVHRNGLDVAILTADLTRIRRITGFIGPLDIAPSGG